MYLFMEKEWKYIWFSVTFTAKLFRREKLNSNLFTLKALPSKHFELLIKNNSGITILNWKLIAYKNKFAERPDFSPSNNRLAWNLIQSTNWSQNGPERKCGKISGRIFSLVPSSKKIFWVSELVSFFSGWGQIENTFWDFSTCK